MTKRFYLTLILIFSFSFSIFSAEIRHSTGLEISFYGPSAFTDDPYSLPSGLGIFYVVSKIAKPSFSLGADLLWYGFVPLGSFYTGSIMLLPSISFGYNFIFNFAHESEFIISPYISYGHYFRSIASTNALLWFNRPVITTGLDIDINTEIKTTSAIRLFLSFILDNKPLIVPGFSVRTGYSRKSGR